MDEETVGLKNGDSVNEDCCMYRMVHSVFMDKNQIGKPKLSAFKPHINDDHKLSLDYDKLTTPEDSLGRFGATKKNNGFKNIEDFSIFSIHVPFVCEELKKLISQIEYNPIENNPLIYGIPNNASHSLAHFIASPDYEPEILARLWTHAKDRNIEFNLDAAKDVADYLISLYGEPQAEPPDEEPDSLL